MSTETNEQEDGAIVAQATNYKMADEGTHMARAVRIIHIGTITGFYEGKPKTQDKIKVVFELPNMPKEGEIKEGQSPVVLVSKEYTNSVSNNSTLRKDLKSWRGSDLTPDEERGFDITTLVLGRGRPTPPKGVAAFVAITHKTSAKGKKYVNISSIMGVPAGMEVPAQINPSFVFSHGIKDDKKFLDAFMKIDKFTQDQIKSSEQWKAREKKIATENPSMLATAVATSAPAAETQGDDDLPF